jgi:hypothetical protein
MSCVLQVLCVWHAGRLLSTSKPSWLGKTSTHRWALRVPYYRQLENMLLGQESSLRGYGIDDKLCASSGALFGVFLYLPDYELAQWYCIL